MILSDSIVVDGYYTRGMATGSPFDDENSSSPPDGGGEGEDPRAYTERDMRQFKFDTTYLPHHLLVERKSGGASGRWTEIGTIDNPDIEPLDWFCWVEPYVPSAPAPGQPAPLPIEFRVMPCDEDNSPLLVPQGSYPSGPARITINFDHKTIRQLRGESSGGGSDAPSGGGGASGAGSSWIQQREQELRERESALKQQEADLLARTLEFSQRETSSLMERNNAVNEQHRNLMEQGTGAIVAMNQDATKRALELQHNAAQEAASSVRESAKAYVEGTKELLHLREAELKAAVEMRKLELQQERLRMEKELAQQKLELAEKEARREREWKEQRADQERKDTAERERQEKHAAQMLQMQNSIFQMQLSSQQAEAARAAEHNKLMVELAIKAANERTDPMAGIAKLAGMLGGDPKEFVQRALGINQEEAAPDVIQMIEAATPLLTFFGGGIIEYLKSRSVPAPAPPPIQLPPPPVVPPLVQLPNAPESVTPTLPPPPPPASPVEAPIAPQAPPNDEPLPAAEMRDARAGVQALLAALGGDAEARSAALKAALNDPTRKILAAWGIKRCIEDAEGPVVKATALQNYLIDLGENFNL